MQNRNQTITSQLRLQMEHLYTDSGRWMADGPEFWSKVTAMGTIQILPSEIPTSEIAVLTTVYIYVHTEIFIYGMKIHHKPWFRFWMQLASFKKFESRLKKAHRLLCHQNLLTLILNCVSIKYITVRNDLSQVICIKTGLSYYLFKIPFGLFFPYVYLWLCKITD